MIPLRRVLQLFFELPNVFQTLIDFARAETTRFDETNKIFTSVYQGSVWKNVLTQYGSKIVFRLYLYYDDFEICNPLSTAAGVHKIGGLYVSIAGMPPEFASVVENVFLGQFIYSADQKQFKNENCFWKIIKELQYLSSVGITITVDSHVYQIHFVMLAVLGDNLGINSLLGFSESFNNDYFVEFVERS